MVGAGLIKARSRLPGKRDSGSGASGNGEVPNPLVALVVPCALDGACCRGVFCGEAAKTLVGHGLHDDVAEAGLSGIGSEWSKI